TGPPDVVGTKLHATMKLLGRPIEGWAEVAEVETPRLIKLIGSAKEGGQLTVTNRFIPAGIAGTDVEMEIEYELPASMLGQIADKVFVEKTVERNLRHSLENFKALVEVKEPVLV
ncbi:MAG TPA: SRPBCC family protein, partial [Candidatus Limnocylindrales bacterium]|nr:SRPBCC family protein [Candidatus Limnocylindrales bacterium]